MNKVCLHAVVLLALVTLSGCASWYKPVPESAAPAAKSASQPAAQPLPESTGSTQSKVKTEAAPEVIKPVSVHRILPAFSPAPVAFEP